MHSRLNESSGNVYRPKDVCDHGRDAEVWAIRVALTLLKDDLQVTRPHGSIYARIDVFKGWFITSGHQ